MWKDVGAAGGNTENGLLIGEIWNCKWSSLGIESKARGVGRRAESRGRRNTGCVRGRR